MHKKMVFSFFILITFYYASLHYKYHKNIHSKAVTIELKEQSLYSEGAFYYSFYKEFTQASSFKKALNNYFINTGHEAPNTINSHKRFNLSFELFTGSLYRFLQNFDFKIPAIDFYNMTTYMINAISVLFILLIVYSLTNSIWLSLLALSLYVTNFDQATRAVTNTPLRENIGISFLLMHIYYTVKLLKLPLIPSSTSLKAIITDTTYIGFIISFVLQLITWQFTQFSILVNIASVLILFCFNLINKEKLFEYFSFILTSWFIAVCYLLGNNLLLNSLLFFICTSYFVCLAFLTKTFTYKLKSKYRMILATAPAALGFIIHSLLSQLNSTGNDQHIFKFISRRFTASTDFHAQLYMCDDAFNSLPIWVVHQFMQSGFLPIYFVCISFIIFRLLMTIKKKFTLRIEILFIALLTLGFTLLALISQRFTIIAVPVATLFMASTVNLILSRFTFFTSRNHFKPIALLILILVLLGTNKTYLSQLNERSRPPSDGSLIKLSEFIKTSTGKNDIIIASMPLSSSLRLLTQRRIFIHPQYENSSLRKKVKDTYKIYGNFHEKDIHSYFKKNQAQFLVLEANYCYFKSNTGCEMKTLVNEGQKETETQFCALNFMTSGYFDVVYTSKNYLVVRLK